MRNSLKTLALLAGAALAIAAQQGVAQRLAKWKRVDMPFHAEGLSARERQMVEKLAEATRLLDQLFWKQQDPAGYALLHTTTDASLRGLLGIMGGRWDLFKDEVADSGTPVYGGNCNAPSAASTNSLGLNANRSTIERRKTAATSVVDSAYVNC